MIDPSAIAQGIIAGIATRKMEKPAEEAIDNLLEIEPHLTSEQTLYDILHVLIKMYEMQAEQHRIELMASTDAQDIFYLLQVNTATTGAPIVFRHKNNKQRFVVQAVVPVILDISAPGLGQLTKTIPADTWTWLMYPENTQIWLDGTNTFNQINLWVRETNQVV